MWNEFFSLQAKLSKFKLATFLLVYFHVEKFIFEISRALKMVSYLNFVNTGALTGIIECNKEFEEDNYSIGDGQYD